MRTRLEASRAEAAAKAAADAERTPAPAPEPASEAPELDADGPEPAGVAEPTPAWTPAWTPAPGGDYRLTVFDDLAHRLDRARFDEPDYTPVLREMVARVVAAEAPIRDDALVERVARAHGIKRNGRLVRERVLALARVAAHVEPEARGAAAFVWPDREAAATWTRARYPASAGDVRPLEDIATPELAAAMRDCASDDPAADVARRFGVRRLSSAGRDRLLGAASPKGHFAP